MTSQETCHIREQVDALADLDRTALLGLWISAFGPDVPPRLSRALMEKAIAYEIQAKTLGSLPARTRRALKAAAKAQGQAPKTLRP